MRERNVTLLRQNLANTRIRGVSSDGMCKNLFKKISRQTNDVYLISSSTDLRKISTVSSSNSFLSTMQHTTHTLCFQLLIPAAKPSAPRPQNCER
jgi:hypothetical protein